MSVVLVNSASVFIFFASPIAASTLARGRDACMPEAEAGALPPAGRRSSSIRIGFAVEDCRALDDRAANERILAFTNVVTEPRRDCILLAQWRAPVFLDHRQSRRVRGTARERRCPIGR